MISQIKAILLAGLLFGNPALISAEDFPKSLITPHAGVASAHVEASRAGVEIMRQGGNAADAAAAVAMALAVVYPQAGNLGGGGFLVYRPASEPVQVYDFRETAPAGAKRHMFLDSAGNVIEAKSLLGGLAVGIPGTVRGIYQFHRESGRLSWQAVLEPAIRLAEEGFTVNRFLAEKFTEYAEQLSGFASTRLIFFPTGKVPQVGQRLVQRDLARSLKDIALHGDYAFYRGQIASEIVKSVRQHGGILTLEDLKNYRIRRRRPLRIEYRGYQIYTVPPPSSGGVVLGGILNALARTSTAELPRQSAERIALLTELEKRFFAVRNQLLGDPEFVNMPLDRLLSPAFAASCLKQLDIHNPLPAQNIKTDNRIFNESPETTHFSVLDRDGNAVSVTYTLNGDFGCKLVAGSTGILLNNEMDDFTSKPGEPNMFGLIQGEANSIQPGKRMLSSMTPVIVTKDGELEGILGSPGGPKIITTVLQVLLNKIDYAMPLDQAISAGRFHHQWLPDSVYMESCRFDSSVLKSLEQWGYRLVEKSPIGDIQAVWRHPAGWMLCSDPRGNGIPLGY